MSGGDHFYTTSAIERNGAAPMGYNYETIAGYVFDSPAQGAIPLYRLFNPKVTKHLYTTSVTEREDSVTRNSYQDEGIAGYVSDSPAQGAIPFYRLFNQQSFDHFYTTSVKERDNSVAHHGYLEQGVTGYVFAAQIPGTIPLYRLFNPIDRGELVEITLSNVHFNLDKAGMELPPRAVQPIRLDLINNTDVEAEAKFQFEIHYTETKKWSTTVNIKPGVKMTVNAGIPFIARGGIEVSAEAGSNTTWGTEQTVEKTYAAEIPVKVSPHSKVVCDASVSTSKVTIPYVAHAVYHFSNDQMIQENFTGTYEGTIAYQLQASWTSPQSV